MAVRHFGGTTRAALALSMAMAAGIAAAGGQSPATGLLALSSARVSISGTSNIHAYTASTDAVRITRVQPADDVAGPNFWTRIVEPGGLAAFEIAVPAATLSSPKEGLDKNMHKALKVAEHPDITFRLTRIERGGAAADALRAIGTLRIAGVEREVALDMTARRSGDRLTVQGSVQVLMTDFGIAPPKAMLGMLKTDPKVTVSFETVLAVPLT